VDGAIGTARDRVRVAAWSWAIWATIRWWTTRGGWLPRWLWWARACYELQGCAPKGVRW